MREILRFLEDFAKLAECGSFEPKTLVAVILLMNLKRIAAAIKSLLKAIASICLRLIADLLNFFIEIYKLFSVQRIAKAAPESVTPKILEKILTPVNKDRRKSD